MSVDAGFIASNVINPSHDEEFVAQRLERFEDAIKALGLQGGRNAETEENVECADWNLRLGGRLRQHLFQKGQTNDGSGDSAEHCASGKKRRGSHGRDRIYLTDVRVHNGLFDGLEREKRTFSVYNRGRAE
jgi:hypothetical protein